MGLQIQILPWMLIVSICCSSAYQTMITCSKEGCQILSQFEQPKHERHARDTKLNPFYEQNVNVTNKDLVDDNQSSYRGLVDDLENMLTLQFNALESNLLHIVTEEIRKNTEIITKNCKQTVIESKASTLKDTRTITQKKTTMSARTTTPISTTISMSTLPSDCWDIFEAGHKTNGVQTIYPQGYKTTVYCDMTSDGGGWTMLLNRQLQQVQENFTRNWQDYKVGFGDRDKEHWLGNEALHLITTAKDYIMRVDAFSGNGIPRNIWGKFNIKVASERELYRLTIKRNDTTGTMDRTFGGGAFVNHNGQFFTTYDRDNDKNAKRNCAKISWPTIGNGGGFWHTNCFHIAPMATYGLIFLKYWSTTSGETIGLASDLEMKLRPEGK